jgi:SAM-dependent methyltransferase
MSSDAPGKAAAPRPNERDWFENWFGEDYLAVYPHRDGREADVVVDFLRERLAGETVERVLDLACGAGRHSRALGKIWWTTGFDLSEALLRVARREAKDACYVRGDMRLLPFRAGSFSLVVNLFTSFGYFNDETENQQVLREVAAATSPGGMFVLDYLNSEQVIRTLKPCDERTVNGVVVEQRRAITGDGKFVEKTIVLSGTKKTFKEKVRLFSRSDLEALVSAAGFVVQEVVGDYRGSLWTRDSERTMLVCTRI